MVFIRIVLCSVDFLSFWFDSFVSGICVSMFGRISSGIVVSGMNVSGLLSS